MIGDLESGSQNGSNFCAIRNNDEQTHFPFSGMKHQLRFISRLPKPSAEASSRAQNLELSEGSQFSRDTKAEINDANFGREIPAPIC